MWLLLLHVVVAAARWQRNTSHAQQQQHRAVDVAVGAGSEISSFH